MSVLEIIVAPDPRLKRRAEPVAKVDDAVRKIMDDMLDTMYAANGIGLAGPQVGILKRIIVVDVARDGDGRQPMQMANPEVIWESDDERHYEEGCLSLPDHFAEVVRPEAVKVRYLDRDNEIRTIDADDILATCIQHEIDHLDGVLFVDHISSLKRNMIIKKLQKLKKQQAEEATA
ncbi:MAG: peptide deformylase [Rhodospirillales bacterium]|tara:strand:- start:105 stop:632 length:528 start_codon:yes stop_codon:yes gene_type:complete